MEGMDLPQMENVVHAVHLDNSPDGVAELMNFDSYSRWCDNPNNLLDQAVPSSSFSPSLSFPPFNSLNFCPYNSRIPLVDRDIMGNLSHGRDQIVSPLSENQFSFPRNFGDHDFNLSRARDKTQDQQYLVGDVGRIEVSRPLMLPIADRMLRALYLLKARCTEKVLAQIWVPMKSGNDYVLSTFGQPYLLDNQLYGYREASKLFTFSIESKPGSFPGLPGRVFTSRIPEWTSNVMYYNKAEYLRINHAVDHEIRGSIALPIFEDDSRESSSCAVLELVTVTEKYNFDLEMDNVCQALEVSFFLIIPFSSHML